MDPFKGEPWRRLFNHHIRTLDRKIGPGLTKPLALFLQDAKVGSCRSSLREDSI